MSQLGALVRLRWRMANRTGQNWRLVLLSVAVTGLLAGAVVAGRSVPEDRFFDFVLITPSLFFAFMVLTLFAPLAAGGGQQLYPADHLAAFPVRPRAVFASSLLLTPLNLAWTAQVLVLVAATALLTGGPATALALITTAAFIGLTTTAGTAIAWLIVGIRSNPVGRRATWVVAGLLALATLAVIRLGWTTAVLDRAPSRPVVDTVVDATGALGSWAVGTGAMALSIPLAFAAGVRATGWALRRPAGTAGAPVNRRYPRQPNAGTLPQTLRRTDRASVWRAPALRRGVVVLAILPSVVVLLAGLDWQALVVLPALVAAGTGLLFGVNAFALDGPGALWLAAQPRWWPAALRAKARVNAEVILAAASTAALLGAVRAPEPASAADVTAVVGVIVAATASVSARSARYAVTRPFRAELGGPRDTPAPPGAMAGYSVRLAVSTTLLGLLFGLLSLSATWWVPLAGAAAFLLISWVSWRRTERLWARPEVRAAVAVTVAGG